MTRLAPPTTDGRTVTAGQVEAHAQAALDAALRYFRIPDNWDVSLYFSGTEVDSGAEVQMDHTYLRARITMNTEYLRANPADIWRVVGHEVAHLTLAPFDLIWGNIRGKTRGEYVRAMENVVVQLERMWLRDNPDPGTPA